MQNNYQTLNKEIVEIRSSINSMIPNNYNFKLLMLKYNIAANDSKGMLDKLYIFTKDNVCLN